MQYEGRARIGHINRSVNEAITVARHDVTWMAPLQAMGLPGDSKSYAVVKYAALAEAKCWGILCGMSATLSRFNSVIWLQLVRNRTQWRTSDPA
jgi:hypothetical protein